jgi:glycosyltransferase involved in cell wall biosynthesis
VAFKPSVTLCMILKDEEVFIENCLKSVQSVVDEIIIVDTGSTDRTKDICREWNAAVYEVPWNGSFSAA